MVPKTERRKPKNSSRVNLLISLGFHAAICIALVYFAARQGLLGKQLKKIAVEMVKEKPPEKPKEPEKPKDEPPKVEPPKIAAAPKVEPPREVPQAAPPPVDAPPAVAPPATEVSSFVFDGGKAVATSSDPISIYKGLVEYNLRSSWVRPTDIDDKDYVAEIEVGVDPVGKIADPVWKKSSGNKRWDDSVRKALASARNVSHGPPNKFPSRFVVRFDVIPTEAVGP